jgi:mannose-6-phosphate isomerase-like protein (cupin superfamily)
MPPRVSVWDSVSTTTMIRFLSQLVLILGYFSVDLVAQELNLFPERNAAGKKAVEVYPLASDSLVSSYLIYIHDEVAPHYHALHSEHVLVIEGEGTMMLNDSLIYLKAKTAVFIPKGSIHSAKRTGDMPLKVLSIQAPFFDGRDRIPVQKNQLGY